MIIAHRGLWRTPAEQNSPDAIAHALRAGFGVEIDVWRDGIGHDGPQYPFDPDDGTDGFLGRYEQALCIGDGPLLLNVKDRRLSDHAYLSSAFMNGLDPARVWLFDHELVEPDLPHYLPDANYLARASDLEHEPLARAIAQPWARGVWLDTFTSPWVTPAVLQQVRDAGKWPVVVSPELHGQAIDVAQWRSWGDAAVCTDVPGLLAGLRAGEAALEPVEAWW